MSLCARLLYTIDLVYGVKKACEQHCMTITVTIYFDNKRQIKQRLSCNAGQAKFLAARAEILAEGAQPTAGGAEPPLAPLTLTTGQGAGSATCMPHSHQRHAYKVIHTKLGVG